VPRELYYAEPPLPRSSGSAELGSRRVDFLAENQAQLASETFRLNKALAPRPFFYLTTRAFLAGHPTKGKASVNRWPGWLTEEESSV